MNAPVPTGQAGGQHDGTARGPIWRRSRRVALWAAAATLSLGVFALYLRPDLAVTLANQLWNCF
jgi:hypothetical protein